MAQAQARPTQCFAFTSFVISAVLKIILAIFFSCMLLESSGEQRVLWPRWQTTKSPMMSLWLVVLSFMVACYVKLFTSKHIEANPEPELTRLHECGLV